MNDNLQVILHHKKDDSFIMPAVLDNVQIHYVISGNPGTLTLSLFEDDALHVEEGDTLQLRYGDKDFFFGFVFEITKDKNDTLKIKAYDQLRYLKNKDYFYYENKKANELVSCLAEDYGLQLGDLEDTGYVIPQKRESNVEIMAMMQNAIDATLINTKEIFILYDDCNKLCLKKPSSLEVPILIDATTASDYDFTTSIDGETYNSIKLITDEVMTPNTKDSKGSAISKGMHKVIYAPNNEAHVDEKNLKQWGLLRLVKEVKTADYKDGIDKVASQLLLLHNTPKRKLSVKGAYGDIRVRAGSVIYCTLKIKNDTEIASKMLVTEVTHTFTNNEHLMDLSLKGGLIND